MEEIWKDIEGYESVFQVSNLGNVRRWVGGTHGRPKRSKTMAIWKNWNRYCLVTLSLRGTKAHHTVHKLVLNAFVGPKPQENFEAAHLDNDRSNNRVENLIWCSRKENHSHKKIHGTEQHGEANGHARWKEEDILNMRSLHIGGTSQSEIARIYQTRQSTIHAIVTKKIWKHI